ncbi:hypothetical protein SDC9_204574 [bioreactor metagenome]|uniref:Uncharacterized protein n=1 Tax=bioreactor metagenome TaxID=1076179 RepID=A0A645IZY4_9ZZZZ
MAFQAPPYILTVGFVLALGNAAIEGYHQFRFWVQTAEFLILEVDLYTVFLQSSDGNKNILR